MKGLTKEGFWNELYKSHPRAVQAFINWIEEYKKREKLDDLFRGPSAIVGDPGDEPTLFHQLPIGMQLGVIFQFFQETVEAPGILFNPFDVAEQVKTIRMLFSFLDNALNDASKVILK